MLWCILDFSLSKALSSTRPSAGKPSSDLDHGSLPYPLPLSYLHLAAQVPGTWLTFPEADLKPSVKLAIRKVVWRALIGGIIADAQFKADPTTKLESQGSANGLASNEDTNQNGGGVPRRRPPLPTTHPQPGLGETPTHRRLGKINDKFYAEWPAFLSAASSKMGLDSDLLSTTLYKDADDRQRMENQLEVLHVLRCVIGPLVESLILLDRLVWIREQLALGEPCERKYKVELVNLFDQETGSARNVAIVLQPQGSY